MKHAIVTKDETWQSEREDKSSEWKIGALKQPRGVGGGGGRREAQEGRDLRIPMAYSCWCFGETNTILESNYPLIKNKFRKEKAKKKKKKKKNDKYFLAI